MYKSQKKKQNFKMKKSDLISLIQILMGLSLTFCNSARPQLVSGRFMPFSSSIGIEVKNLVFTLFRYLKRKVAVFYKT